MNSSRQEFYGVLLKKSKEMAASKCEHCNILLNKKAKVCQSCGAINPYYKSKKPVKWFQKTSISLSVAAVLIIIGFGFIHIITGVRTRIGLPYDFALKKSFGYKETFVDAGKIVSIPFVTATIKYPKSCEVLQRLGYIDSSGAFEQYMKDNLLESLQKWQSDFLQSLNIQQQSWNDKLLENTEKSERELDDYELNNKRGIAAAKQIQFDRAISEFSRAIQRNPTFADAYFNRALVYDAFGQIEKSVSDFTKVIEIRPDFIEAYMNRAQIYMSNNNYEQAENDYNKIIELDPKSAQAYFNRSLIYFSLGRYDDTWDEVKKIENLGYKVPSEYLDILRRFSR